jgi:hypothetical protein
MKIVAEEDPRRGEDLRVVSIQYDAEDRGRARIVMSLESYQGALYAVVRLTHQEARALGHALLTDAARAQKELEG